MSQHALASADIEVGVHRTVTFFGFALNIDTIWTTAIALLIAFAFRPQGFTVFIGLAVFQLLMMGSTASAMVRQLRG